MCFQIKLFRSRIDFSPIIMESTKLANDSMTQLQKDIEEMSGTVNNLYYRLTQDEYLQSSEDELGNGLPYKRENNNNKSQSLNPLNKHEVQRTRAIDVEDDSNKMKRVNDTEASVLETPLPHLCKMCIEKCIRLENIYTGLCLNCRTTAYCDESKINLTTFLSDDSNLNRTCTEQICRCEAVPKRYGSISTCLVCSRDNHMETGLNNDMLVLSDKKYSGLSVKITPPSSPISWNEDPVQTSTPLGLFPLNWHPNKGPDSNETTDSGLERGSISDSIESNFESLCDNDESLNQSFETDIFEIENMNADLNNKDAMEKSYTGVSSDSYSNNELFQHKGSIDPRPVRWRSKIARQLFDENINSLTGKLFSCIIMIIYYWKI